jgi:ABC-type phosphonate transport system ATPase subunit
MLGQLPGSNMSQIYTMAFLLSLVVMGTCVMMISSSLNSNVSQRMEFFGLLRCLGATRRQVLRFVRREALQWCITAIPIGIGLSIVVVWGLCAVMRQLSTVWFGYMPIFGISWLSIGVSIVLGLTERRHHLPSQLSGGQQQRVAIGRALVTRPALILADEPTGNLDSKNSQEVLALLQTMSAKYQQTILMITHNKNHASAADRIFNMSDGVLKELGVSRK